MFDTKNIVLFSIFGLILAVFIYMRVKAIIDSLKTDKWPPEIDICPNMWVRKGNKCVNVLGIGNKRCAKTFDLNRSLNFKLIGLQGCHDKYGTDEQGNNNGAYLEHPHLR